MTLESFLTIWTEAARGLGNHLWQSTVFAAVIALLNLTLRRYQARTRYWLWLAASAKFLIPFSLLVGLGAHVAWSNHRTPKQGMYAAIDAMSQPFIGVTGSNVPMHSMVGKHADSTPMFLVLALTIVWLCGFIAVLIFWYAQWRRLSTVMRDGEPLVEGREVEALRRMEQTAGMPRRIAMLGSRDSMEPGVFGILRPTLLWPKEISQRLEDAQLEAVLAHEVCHVQRHDNLTSVVHMLVEAVFWFHPLVWWMERRLVEERERACDEEVLRLGKQPMSYAEGILKVCEFCMESPLTCVSGITGADLKKRIVHIMRESVISRLSFSRKLLLIGAGSMAIAMPILFGQANAAQGGTAAEADIANAKTSAFEVAVIRPSKPGSGVATQIWPGGRIVVRGATLRVLMLWAYDIRSFQLSGGPAWLDSEQYDIDAKPDHPEENKKALMQMLQSLLADRFKLVVDHETAEFPGYDLVRTKEGPKLHLTGQEGVLLPNSQFNTAKGRVVAKKMPMSQVAKLLSDQFGRPVVDKTELKGNYDFVLEWMPDEAASDTTSGPSLMTALQEELGLQVRPAKVMAEKLVVDHVEKPSAN